MTQPPVYVVNLDRDVARMSVLAAELARHNVDFIRVSAVLGASLADAEKARLGRRWFWRERRALTWPEVGCTLSHRRVLERFLESGAPRALILEDDAVLPEDFAGLLAALAAEPGPADILKLEGIDLVGARPRGWPLGPLAGRERMAPAQPALASAAYAVTQAGARKLFAATERIHEPYDWTLTDYLGLDLSFAELRPFPIRQAEIASGISPERTNADAADRGPGYRLRKSLDKRLRPLRLAVWRRRRGYPGGPARPIPAE